MEHTKIFEENLSKNKSLEPPAWCNRVNNATSETKLPIFNQQNEATLYKLTSE